MLSAEQLIDSTHILSGYPDWTIIPHSNNQPDDGLVAFFIKHKHDDWWKVAVRRWVDDTAKVVVVGHEATPDEAVLLRDALEIAGRVIESLEGT